MVWDFLLNGMLAVGDMLSDKKATEIPSDLLTASAESRVTVINFSRNCLTAVPTGSVTAACWLMSADVDQHWDGCVFICNRSTSHSVFCCWHPFSVSPSFSVLGCSKLALGSRVSFICCFIVWFICLDECRHIMCLIVRKKHFYE